MLTTAFLQAARSEQWSHLDIDAFVCLANAGDGRRRGLARVGGGAGVVGGIQKALL